MYKGILKYCRTSTTHGPCSQPTRRDPSCWGARRASACWWWSGGRRGPGLGLRRSASGPRPVCHSGEEWHLGSCGSLHPVGGKRNTSALLHRHSYMEFWFQPVVRHLSELQYGTAKCSTFTNLNEHLLSQSDLGLKLNRPPVERLGMLVPAGQPEGGGGVEGSGVVCGVQQRGPQPRPYSLLHAVLFQQQLTWRKNRREDDGNAL